MTYNDKQIAKILEENRSLKKYSAQVLAQAGKATGQLAHLIESLVEMAPGGSESKWRSVTDIDWLHEFFPEIAVRTRFQLGRHLAKISKRMGLAVFIDGPHHYYQQAAIDELKHMLEEDPDFMKSYRKPAAPQIDYVYDDEKEYCDLDCENCRLDCEEAAI